MGYVKKSGEVLLQAKCAHQQDDKAIFQIIY